MTQKATSIHYSLFHRSILGTSDSPTSRSSVRHVQKDGNGETGFPTNQPIAYIYASSADIHEARGMLDSVQANNSKLVRRV